MKPRGVNTNLPFKVQFSPCGHTELTTLEIFDSWGGTQDQFDRIDAGYKTDEPSLHTTACPVCGPYAYPQTFGVHRMILNPCRQLLDLDD